MTQQLEAIEACENGTATILQQRLCAKAFRDAWLHEGENAKRLAQLRAVLESHGLTTLDNEKETG